MITQWTTDVPGQIGIQPREIAMVATDNYATITSAGYTNQIQKETGLFVQPTDVVRACYNNNTAWGFFSTSTVSGVTTLKPIVEQGEVILPVVSGDFANFSGTTGAIHDAGFSPTSASYTKVAMVSEGVSVSMIPSYVDTAGSIGLGYSASNEGLETLASISGVINIGHLAEFEDADGTISDSGIVANTVLTSAIAGPDTSINLVRFDVTVGFAGLATTGKVNLYVSSGSKQYKVVNLWINSGGTNFSGGSGNRLLAISDGSTVYSVIPATNLGTLINSGWGISTPLPYPASAAINTSTAAGATLFAQYSGGSADYTAGSIVISGILQRVA